MLGSAAVKVLVFWWLLSLRGLEGNCCECIKLFISFSVSSFNQLDLPAYETYDKLRQMLLLAIHECSEGFGLA